MSNQEVATVGNSALVPMSDKYADEIAALKKAVEAPSAQRIKINKKGIYVMPDESEIGEEFRCVVLDFIPSQAWWEERFDSKNPAPPDCAAISRDVTAFVPFNNAPKRQSDTCDSCPQFKWGSDPIGGKGKACKSSRVLAVLPVDDPDGEIHLVTVSATGIKPWDTYISSLADNYNLPPYAVITTLKVAEAGNGHRVDVNVKDATMNELADAYNSRRLDASKILERDPDFGTREVGAE